MKRLCWVLHVVLLALVSRSAGAGPSARVALVPLPAEVKFRGGEFVLGPRTAILVDPDSTPAVTDAAASIVIHQVGTTGTATRADIGALMFGAR
jgi:hypothetical protein